MRISKTRPWLVVPAAAALVLGVALAGPAHATPPAGAAASGVPTAPVPTAASAAKAGQRSAAAPATADTALLSKQEALLPTARDLAAQAVTSGSDIAGVALDINAGAVDVYRTDTSRPVQLSDRSVITGKVRVHQAAFSRTTMTRAADRVTQDAALLGARGVSVQGVGPAVDGSGIAVSVYVPQAGDAAALNRAASVLRGQYGAVVGKVNAVNSLPSQDELFLNGFRFNDFAPWYGGDRIQSNVGGCTTGFAANFNGGPVMLTAAHCGPVGTQFFNGPTTAGTFNLMGNSVYSNPPTDVGALSVTSASTFINVGSAEAPTQLNITSWASPVVNELLCQSGSYTGEVCGLRVVDTGQFQCIASSGGVCTQFQGPLADVINTAGSGAYAAGHGDSGGPVFQRSNTSAKGLVHGQLTPNARAAFPAYFPDTLLCPTPGSAPQPRCSSGFSFAHMPGF